ncbi:hypothetical protein IRJ41_022117, partial [Triplophysa rosa]
HRVSSYWDENKEGGGVRSCIIKHRFPGELLRNPHPPTSAKWQPPRTVTLATLMMTGCQPLFSALSVRDARNPFSTSPVFTEVSRRGNNSVIANGKEAKCVCFFVNPGSRGLSSFPSPPRAENCHFPRRARPGFDGTGRAVPDSSAHQIRTSACRLAGQVPSQTADGARKALWRIAARFTVSTGLFLSALKGKHLIPSMWVYCVLTPQL